MKYLLFIILLLSFAGIAQATNDARYDWSQGQPTTVENPTAATANCATMYNWSMGQPTVVYNSTASCPAATTIIFTADSSYYHEEE